MKKLTKQRIVKPLLAVSPFAVYIAFAFILAIAVAFICEAMGMSADEVENLPLIKDGWLDELCIGIAAIFAISLVKKVNKVSIKEVISVKNFDIAVPLMLTVFAWSFGEVADHFCGLVLSNFMTVEPNKSIPLGFAGIVVAVICAPIFEEIIFRFAGTELPKGAYSMPIICIANSLYFAAVHGYNVQGFLNVFVGGVCMAYVYCKTGNLLYTMIEHAIHNALCFIPLNVFYYEKNGFMLGKWYWVAANAAAVVVCIVYYFKVFSKKYTENHFEVNRETGLPYKESIPQDIEKHADMPLFVEELS